MNNPKKYEIWLAKVYFEDSPNEYKHRPVLVISEQEAFILSLKMTSKDTRSNFFGEYRVQNWRESGLNKPTVIRCSKKIRIERKFYIKKIGDVHIEDIINVLSILSQI